MLAEPMVTKTGKQMVAARQGFHSDEDPSHDLQGCDTT
jgi:hypothetical protein